MNKIVKIQVAGMLCNMTWIGFCSQQLEDLKWQVCLLKKKHFVGTHALDILVTLWHPPSPAHHGKNDSYLLIKCQYDFCCLLRMSNAHNVKWQGHNDDSQGCKDRLHSGYPLSYLDHQGWIRTMRFKNIDKFHCVLDFKWGIDRCAFISCISYSMKSFHIKLIDE